MSEGKKPEPLREMTMRQKSKLMKKGLSFGLSRPSIGLALRVGDGVTFADKRAATAKIIAVSTPQKAGNRRERRARKEQP